MFAEKVLNNFGLFAPTSLDYNEDITIIIEVVRNSSLPPFDYLGGIEPINQIEVQQWLSFAKKSSAHPKSDSKFWSSTLTTLNDILYQKSYLVGYKVTAADSAVFNLIRELIDVDNLLAHSNVSRWFDHLQHWFQRVNKQVNLIDIPKRITLLPVPNGTIRDSSSQNNSTSPIITEKISSTVEETKGEKSTSNAKSKKEKETSVEKSKVPAEAPPASEAADAGKLDPSKLDIRVGKVVKCWNHPESEKLLCEEIDVQDADGAVRSIASGIRAFYSAEELQGRLVLVLCNLKERAIAGFKSQGMVLCASNKDHTVVRLLEPPASAKAGDRVTFAGFEGEPATAAQVAKKKILEGLLPELRTDSNGVATWNSVPFAIGSEVCRSQPNSNIS